MEWCRDGYGPKRNDWRETKGMMWTSSGVFIHIRDPKGGQDQKFPLIREARELLLSHPRTASPFVFPGRQGRQRVDIAKQVNRIKQRAGLPKDFRALHGLRHFYASMLALPARWTFTPCRSSLLIRARP